MRSRGKTNGTQRKMHSGRARAGEGVLDWLPRRRGRAASWPAARPCLGLPRTYAAVARAAQAEHVARRCAGASRRRREGLHG